MLTPADVRMTKTGTAELSQNGKKLQIKVVESANVTLKTWSRQQTHNYDVLNPGTTLVGFEVILPVNSKSPLNVSLISDGITASKYIKIPSLMDWKN